MSAHPGFDNVILSGIRATGRLHFGNFIGAVRHFVKYQRPENMCLFFVADTHTLTTLRNPEELRGNILEVAKDYLAAGLNPDASSIYVQSSIPELAELTLLLSMVQALGPLLLIPTYKDLVRKNPDNVNLGLVTYPVMMAADILGPQATLVPVGEDQRPNLELARNLAQTFNNRFGETFVVPEMMHEMVKVPGLDGQKMGKSESDNSIPISASRAEIEERYRSQGITDTKRVRASDPGDPYNRCLSVYPLHEMITTGEKDTREIANQCLSGTLGCVDCKKKLVASIMEHLEPFQERRADLKNRDDYVRGVLAEGSRRARRHIQDTLADVREKMGITVY